MHSEAKNAQADAQPRTQAAAEEIIKFNGELEPKIQEEPIETKDQLMEKLRDIHLEEWRKEYSPEQYGITILEGTQ